MYFLFGYDLISYWGCNILPQKELHRSLQVVGSEKYCDRSGKASSNKACQLGKIRACIMVPRCSNPKCSHLPLRDSL